MKQTILIIFSIFLPFTFLAQSKKVQHTIFLIGDAGEPLLNGSDAVLSTLQQRINLAGKNSSVIFLGDNIYPIGMVSEDHPNRKQAEARFAAQLDIIKNSSGQGFVIPGNHDWQQGGKNGWEYIKNQEKFVTDYLQRNDVFYPKGGCPTPQEIHVSNDLTLVLLDTQWYLHPWKKPEDNSDCEVKSLAGMLTTVDDIIFRNQDKKVIVLGHHPMYSHGSHGGYFTVKDHLLPLHELGINIPLPVIGSIYPLFRSMIGNIQDIPNPVYKEMSNGLTSIFKQYSNVIYANGHEHNLQLIVRDSINYITSGSGSKHTPVKKGKDSEFAAETKGFAQLEYLEDGTLLLSFISGKNEVLFQKEIHLKTTAFQAPNLLINDKKANIPNPHFKANTFKTWLLGSNYRDIWTKPIVTPILDFQHEKGGLKIIQRGGGQQTLSLRYQAKDGGQYVTRSVEKYPESAVPESIRSKFTVEIVGDQISASHPFAALTVPTLADAAGVLHTNPRLVTIPNDTTLGKYQRLFAGQLALFEERPEEGFAGAKKTLSTLKLFDKLEEDNKNKVDQKATLRARLLDMFIGDWDRHEDQWRWAAYDNGKNTLYQPIPRDRDQAYFVSQGLLPRIISRKWILPKIQGFDYQIRDINTFNYNARYVDRAFLTELSEQDWLDEAKAFQQNMTEATIDSAIAKLPQNDPHASEIINKLKQRKKDMVQYAQAYYQFLAKEVDIVASDKDEFIEVIRQEDGQTEVSIFDKNKKDEKGKQTYHRIFQPTITKEIRIWGLDGDDKFSVKGQAEKGIRVRLIGGKGKDAFVDSSKVARGAKKTLIYDKTKNTLIQGSEETADKTSDSDKRINDLDRFAFVYDRIAPLGSFAYNPDDGIFIGGGVQLTKQGFRKTPYKTQHNLSGNYAFSTKAFNLFYVGNFVDLIGKADLELKITLQQEGITDNFFGLSNESVYLKEKGIRYYRTKLSNYENSAILKNHFNKLTLYYGVVFTGFDVSENTNRFINDFAPAGSELYAEKDYLGIKTGLTIDTRNNPVIPTRGLRWDISGTYQHGISNNYKDEYFNLKSDIAFYHTFKLPATVSFGTRFGGGINLADYEFYQANSLGGLSNLRGFRRTRFSGKSSFYNNTEVRVKLLTLKSYLFPANLGVLAFNDVGRVWNPNEKSDKWHHGYGGGIWLAPFQMAVISGTYAMSEEDKIVTIKLGFFF